jgi:hypothetical protein
LRPSGPDPPAPPGVEPSPVHGRSAAGRGKSRRCTPPVGRSIRGSRAGRPWPGVGRAGGRGGGNGCGWGHPGSGVSGTTGASPGAFAASGLTDGECVVGAATDSAGECAVTSGVVSVR